MGVNRGAILLAKITSLVTQKAPEIHFTGSLFFFPGEPLSSFNGRGATPPSYDPQS